MKGSNRDGGSFDSDHVRALSFSNVSWNLGAHRDGWELLNWRERSSMPGSMDYSDSQRGYMGSLATIWDDRKGQGQKVGASDDSRLVDWLSEKYAPHPELKRFKSLNFRLLSFQEPEEIWLPGIYILEVPTVLKFGRIASDHVQFAEIEDKLIQEQVMPQNIDCLLELAQLKKEGSGVGLYSPVKNGDTLMFDVRYIR